MLATSDAHRLNVEATDEENYKDPDVAQGGLTGAPGIFRLACALALVAILLLAGAKAMTFRRDLVA